MTTDNQIEKAIPKYSARKRSEYPYELRADSGEITFEPLLLTLNLSANGVQCKYLIDDRRRKKCSENPRSSKNRYIGPYFQRRTLTQISIGT